MDVTVERFEQDLARAGYAKLTQQRYVAVGMRLSTISQVEGR